MGSYPAAAESLCLMQIQAEAYILTLCTQHHLLARTQPQQIAVIHNIPIDTSPRHPSPNPPRRKTILFENSGVPRFEACGAEEDFAAGLEGAVESAHLGEGVGVLGVEPVHAVHDLGCSC